MQYWKKLSKAQISDRIKNALAENIDYKVQVTLGIPASTLDSEVFDDEAPFLSEAPMLQTFVSNPNHIGCHTGGHSERFFQGTQAIEKEVIETLAVDFLNANVDSTDGYIASGGTESNIQAVWMYRNMFIHEYQASLDDIAIICSEDTHYSIDKASNLLCIDLYKVAVDEQTRQISVDGVEQVITEAILDGKKHMIVIANMGTTMFGSIDSVDIYTSCLEERELSFFVHVDGAFGGFIYPISMPNNHLSFTNPHISSFTLDAHKMLQAPYGTGIFLCRKGLIHHVLTDTASYVAGMDMTLSGSRSGANAIAVWMILFTYGPYGWLEKINKLLYRTHWVCQALDKLDIPYFRQKKMNIVTIPATHISAAIAHKYGLVPDTHDGHPQWYKIVVMDHAHLESLQAFISAVATDRIVPMLN